VRRARDRPFVRVARSLSRQTAEALISACRPVADVLMVLASREGSRSRKRPAVARPGGVQLRPPKFMVTGAVLLAAVATDAVTRIRRRRAGRA
jgi:hypothetical protein